LGFSLRECILKQSSLRLVGWPPQLNSGALGRLVRVMADDLDDFAKRLRETPVDPDGSLEDFAERAGMDSYRREPTPTDHTELFGILDPSSGHSARFLEFEESEIEPEQYPEGFPYLARVSGTLMEVDTPSGLRQSMIWGMLDDPDTVWQQLDDVLSTSDTCAVDWDLSTAQSPNMTVKRAKIFYRHPQHDSCRQLIWYATTNPESDSIVLSGPLPYERPNEGL
jgi:hypothetical protein